MAKHNLFLKKGIIEILFIILPSQKQIYHLLVLGLFYFPFWLPLKILAALLTSSAVFFAFIK